MARVRVTAIAAMLCTTLGLGGCQVVSDTAYDLLGIERPLPGGDTDAFDTDWDEQLETSRFDAGAEAQNLDVGSVEAEPTAVLPLVRSEKMLPLPGHGSASMGFRVDKLAAVYALAGAIEVPPWSAPHEGGPRTMRDDDIDTAWTCVPSGEDRCAVGMHFPSVAKAHSIRLFAATQDFEFYPRPKRVRVHTEAGFTDVLLADTNAPQFIEFAEPVVTRNLIIEVLEVFPGSAKEPKIHITDLEVFGVAGVAREPLELDPSTAVVVPTISPWRKAARATYDRTEMFVHWTDSEGNLHRLVEGTALRGRKGDRLLLIERVSGQGECDAPRGTFFMLDTKTRVTAPLGDLDGVGGDTFRAADGQGIVIGYQGKLDTQLNGIFAEPGKYRRRQTPFRADLRAGEDYFEEWKLDAQKLRREPPALNESIEGCTIGDEALVAELNAAKEAAAPKKRRRKPKKRRGDPEGDRPAAWQICELSDGARAFITDNGPCGASWEMTVLGSDGTIVATQSGKGERSFLRVARLGDNMLVQVGDGTDQTSVWRATAEGLTEVAPRGMFALQPPAICRENCLEPFPNPNAPVWQ
jgi:hypothetical protein